MNEKHADNRSCEQKAKDRAILMKLANEQTLTEGEDDRLDELVGIAAVNLGLKVKLKRQK
ncbi:hypothetical protein [ANMV-1 virus]|nr:hypothetical protein [ANMV-1 virus]